MSQFNILDVAELLNLEMLQKEKKGTEFSIVCPYCGDKRGKMSLCISKNNKEKNTYHCYHCNSAGNMLGLYADLKGISGGNRFKEAYQTIGELIDANPERNKKQVKIKTDEAKFLADEAICDRTLRALFEMLPLKEKHKQNLLDRGMTEEEISMYMLKSVPTESAEKKAICRRLLSSGYKLYGVPPFFQDKNGDWTMKTYPRMAGIICPVIQCGYVVGFQIRLDKVLSGRKYIWASSKGEKSGISSGSPATLLGDKYDTNVVITEGILKAMVYHCFTGNTVIGTPGIANINSVFSCIKRMPNVKTVTEAYDMDKYMPVDCRRDCGEKCKDCDGGMGSNCAKKVKKRNTILQEKDKLLDRCKTYGLKATDMKWDYDVNTGCWMEQFKGIDDYYQHLRERKLGENDE